MGFDVRLENGREKKVVQNLNPQTSTIETTGANGYRWDSDLPRQIANF